MVQLRRATADDLPLLARHRDAMWLEMGRLERGKPDPSSKAYAGWLGERMAKGTLVAFVAEADGVVGSGGVWMQEVQPRPGHPRTVWGYVLSIYTEPAHRRQGVAHDLVAACLAEARAHGCTRATLHASKVGRSVYESFGFEPTDEMWLDLRAPAERPKRKSAPRAATSLADSPERLRHAKTRGRPAQRVAKSTKPDPVPRKPLLRNTRKSKVAPDEPLGPRNGPRKTAR